LAYGQETFVNKQYGFSMQEPKGWISTNKAYLTENLEKFELTDVSLAKLLKDNNDSIVLAAFYKYELKTTAGLIPTIQIRVRTKTSTQYQEFKSAIVQSLEKAKHLLEEYEIVDVPKEINISGIKSVFIVSKFKMKGLNGQILKVRSRTYAIPFRNYFFQVNFTDEQVGEDCTAEFDKLVKTITIGRETGKS
jgi:hypothetical protein